MAQKGEGREVAPPAAGGFAGTGITTSTPLTTSDLRSLLAAIVADPGDDTARLVYADCLEEHGNSARAEFIRLQVEAERLHPHSNARAKLGDRVRFLTS